MDATKDTSAVPHMEVINSPPSELHLKLSGDLTGHTISRLWKQCTRQIKTTHAHRLILNVSEIATCDGAGIGLLSYLIHFSQKHHITPNIVGLRSELKPLLDRFTHTSLALDIPIKQLSFIESVGKQTYFFFQDIYDQISFFAHIIITGIQLAFKPWRFRWNDFFKIAEQAGVLAAGIVSLLGLLFGLIMAFSSAMPLRQFGVEIYVSDLVAVALVRVLGPFITAVIVAGRTGSAFAAELGTMKVNNEIDALRVMNLDPVAFLVLPRVLATTVMTPLLTIAANLLGLIGSAIVILSLGYSLMTYSLHIQSILTIPDVLVGLVKSLVYGVLIGTVGCLRGLQTKIGAGAVGISTTRAVVTSIILLVFTEGIFSVLLFYLDI